MNILNIFYNSGFHVRCRFMLCIHNVVLCVSHSQQKNYCHQEDINDPQVTWSLIVNVQYLCKMWGESSLNWVLETCPTSFIELNRQPRALPSHQRDTSTVSTGFSCYTCSYWPILSVRSLTRIQVMPCKGNDWLLSQTFPKVIGRVASTRHVTSSMSFLPRFSKRCTLGITAVKKARGIFITVYLLL